MKTRPHRRELVPVAQAPGDHACGDQYTGRDNPSVAGLAAELAALDDEALAEQAALLALAAQHAALTPVVLLRLRLITSELARRFVAREGVAP